MSENLKESLNKALAAINKWKKVLEVAKEFNDPQTDRFINNRLKESQDLAAKLEKEISQVEEAIGPYTRRVEVFSTTPAYDIKLLPPKKGAANQSWAVSSEYNPSKVSYILEGEYDNNGYYVNPKKETYLAPNGDKYEVSKGDTSVVIKSGEKIPFKKIDNYLKLF